LQEKKNSDENNTVVATADNKKLPTELLWTSGKAWYMVRQF